MTEDEREELIEEITHNIGVACGYLLTPWRYRIVQAHARAALAVAEPVIREWCAKIAEKTPYAFDAGKDMNTIAAAIREGKDD